MNTEQAAKYIGLPHKYGANGPDAYDCWHFLKHCLLTYFDRHMPELPIGDAEICRNCFEEKVRSGKWTPLEDKPEHGAAALLKGGVQPHVGIYLDIEGGGVLHCLEGHGVVFDSMKQLYLSGFGRARFYRIEE